jgi:membrane peptidoglycan carboxypeptidase
MIGLCALALPAMAAAVGGAVWVQRVYDSAPALDRLRPLGQDAVSTVYAADGTRLGDIHFDTEREPVPSSRIAPALDQATVAIEDKDFYREGGLDLRGIVRAAWQDLLAGGKPRQGGSTITQQLVRDLYIEHPRDTLKRKIVEAHLANDENARYSKDAILTQYLNTASYGTNGGASAVGVQAAAETYFSRPASRLTLDEAALLAGLPQAPSQFNPLLHPSAARKRRDEVLQAMEKQGSISASRYASAVHAGLGLTRRSATRACASLTSSTWSARSSCAATASPPCSAAGSRFTPRSSRGSRRPRRARSPRARSARRAGRRRRWRRSIRPAARSSRWPPVTTPAPVSSTSPRRRTASRARRSRRSC